MKMQEMDASNLGRQKVSKHLEYHTPLPTCLSPTHSTAGDEARLENDGLFIWPRLKLFSNGVSRSAISCLNRACKTPSPSSAWLNATRLLRFTAKWRRAVSSCFYRRDSTFPATEQRPRSLTLVRRSSHEAIVDVSVNLVPHINLPRRPRLTQ
jgi:hypothetical protein